MHPHWGTSARHNWWKSNNQILIIEFLHFRGRVIVPSTAPLAPPLSLTWHAQWSRRFSCPRLQAPFHLIIPHRIWIVLSKSPGVICHPGVMTDVIYNALPVSRGHVISLAGVRSMYSSAKMLTAGIACFISLVWFTPLSNRTKHIYWVLPLRGINVFIQLCDE